MKCKYCKQWISLLDWVMWFGKCNHCILSLQDIQWRRRKKENSIAKSTSDEYWRNK